MEESILERIKKLMALADSAANQHEAALAANRMQALLQEHNLTRAEVESHARDNEPESPLTAQRESLTHERSAMYTYQADLMSTVAKGNFCMHAVIVKSIPDPNGRYIRRSDDVRVRKAKVHMVIGRSDNVAVTITMYDYLIETMNRLLPFEGSERRSTDARLWLAGCAESLCDRLTSQRTKREREEQLASRRRANTPGLVLLKDVYATEQELNLDFCKGLAPGTTTKQRLEDEAEERQIKAKFEELVKSGTTRHDAWFLARDMEVPGPNPQKISRVSRSTRSYRRENHAEWRKDQREYERRNHPSFKDGKLRGEEIGLGGSLKGSTQKSIKE